MVAKALPVQAVDERAAPTTSARIALPAKRTLFPRSESGVALLMI
jgi:hypothetical protein